MTTDVQQTFLIWFRPVRKRPGKWKVLGRSYGVRSGADRLLDILRRDKEAKGQGGEWQVLPVGSKPDTN
jgi:hypothetical protein